MSKAGIGLPFSERTVWGLAPQTRRVLLSLLIIVVIWELVGRYGIKTGLIFAPLSDIFLRMFEMGRSGELWKHVKASGSVFLIGYTLAVIFGILLGILIASSRRFSNYLDPWLGALYATPMIALAPVFIVLMGIGPSSKIVIIFIEAFFPITVNAALGIRSTDSDVVEASKSFGATRGQVIRTVLLPFAAPFIIAGMRIAVARALAGVLVAEIFGSVAGIGNMIWFSAEAYDMPKLFTGVLLLVGTSILLMGILSRFERYVAPWRK